MRLFWSYKFTKQFPWILEIVITIWTNNFFFFWMPFKWESAIIKPNKTSCILLRLLRVYLDMLTGDRSSIDIFSMVLINRRHNNNAWWSFSHLHKICKNDDKIQFALAIILRTNCLSGNSFEAYYYSYLNYSHTQEKISHKFGSIKPTSSCENGLIKQNEESWKPKCDTTEKRISR